MSTSIEPTPEFGTGLYRDPVPPEAPVPVDRSIKDSSGDLIMTIGYDFVASPEAVYDAWTTPEGLAAWFGPTGFHAEGIIFEAWPGGEWSLIMVDEAGERYPAHGTVVDLQRPSTIVLTDCWDVLGVDAPDTTITVDVAQSGVQTTIMMRAEPMPTRGLLVDSQAGWLESFVKLNRYLAGGLRRADRAGR